MKTWVNIFYDEYDPTTLYVSKSYASKKEATDGIRKSMRYRLVDTVNLKNLIKK